jgi:hypothetical protein
MDMEKLENDIKAVKELGLKKVEGDGYIVYKVGKIIRIDIKED